MLILKWGGDCQGYQKKNEIEKNVVGDEGCDSGTLVPKRFRFNREMETCFDLPPASKSELGDLYVYVSFVFSLSSWTICFASPYQSRTSDDGKTMNEPDQVRVGAKGGILISHSRDIWFAQPCRDGQVRCSISVLPVLAFAWDSRFLALILTRARVTILMPTRFS